MDELDRQDADGNSSHASTSVLEIGRCEKKRNRKAKEKATLAMGESTNLQAQQPLDPNLTGQKELAQPGSNPRLKKECKLTTVCIPKDTVDRFIRAAQLSTDANKETLGALAGRKKNLQYVIEKLYIPQQWGKSDQCGSLEEG